MDKDRLIQRLMKTFLGELEEHVRSLNRDLLRLEKAPAEGQVEVVQALFRTAHNLKGAARAVNVQPIEIACHRLEGVLGDVRDDRRPLSTELVQLLFATADALQDAWEKLRRGGDLAGAPIHGLLTQLEASGRDATSARTPVSARAARTTITRQPAWASTVEDGVVRVSRERLDTLLTRSGELLVARRRAAARHADVAQLSDAVQRCRTHWQRLDGPLRTLTKSHGAMLPTRARTALDGTRESLKALDRSVELLSSRMAVDTRTLEQAAGPLEDEIRRVRMLPFGEVCEGLERVVRDLARAGGKQADLVIEGGDVEIDRAVLERLKDPLLHLVRNAVDHGVELPDERVALGKPTRASVTVAATLRGSHVEVAVADDGRGLDMTAVREQARLRNLAAPEDDRDAAHLIFLPGFSTVPLVTELSGRGVGLDVVKHRVESLHGHVMFSFEPDRGAGVVLTVPLTLTTIRALLLGVGGQLFALPTTTVRRLLRVGPADLASVGGRDVLLSDGPPVPVVSLADVLGPPIQASHRGGGKIPLVVVTSGDREVAFAVDELLTEQEFVVKSLGRRIRRVRHVAGATVLATGRVGLILSVADLIETALRQTPGHTITTAFQDRSLAVKTRILLVEDSVTTRTLEKSILEDAGYDVLVAADGREAWQLIQRQRPDLVVADVEMPHIDGFALCEAIRRSKRFRDLPVVLITGLEGEQHKARGLEVGADAYLVKSVFDQGELLQTIGQLLQRLEP